MAIRLAQLQQEFQQRQIKVPLYKQVGNVGKSIAKDAFQALIVRPGTRIGQAAAYGIGEVVGGYRGELIKQRALGNQEVDVGPLGKYNIQELQPGATGYRQVAGEALESASYLYTPGRVAGMIAKPGLKLAVKEGAKIGAKIGATYGSGKSLQKKDLSASEFIKDTGTGALFGAVGGGVLGAAGYGGTKLIQSFGKVKAETITRDPKIQELQVSWQKLQQKKGNTTNKFVIKQLEKAQKKIEQQVQGRVAQIQQGGFAQVPGGPKKTIKPTGTGSQEGVPIPVNKGQKSHLDGAGKSSYGGSVDEVSKFYNTERLNIPDKAKKAITAEIENQGELLGKTVGTRLSNKEVIDTAAATSRILSKTVTREETKATIAANLKLRQKISAMAKLDDAGQLNPDFIKILIKDKSAGEDIARQLQARRIGAEPRDHAAIDIILDSILKVNKNAEDIINASKGINFNDPNQVTKFFREFIKPRAEDWIDALRYNSMLSSPTTHFVNISSNLQGTGILTPVEKTISGFYDAMGSALSGNPRQHLIGEGSAYAKGYISNLGNAASKLWNIARGKEMASYVQATEFVGDASKVVPLATSKTGRVIENTLKFPSRLMEAADQFFTTLTEGGLTKAQQYRAAKGVGDLTKTVQEEAAYRLFRGQLGEKQGHILDAMDYLPRKILEARNSENPVVRILAKFTFPFVKTPINLFKQGLEYSPAGVSTLWGATNKIEQLSKITIGTATAAGVATLLGSDRLTFGEPTSEKQRAEFRAAGRQPYSIKIGDKWINYSKLHPAFAFNFALVAAVDDAIENKGLSDDEAETILGTAAKYMNFLADQSYLKSIGDFVATAKGDSEGLVKYLGNYPQQFIPFRALMSWIERAVDPIQRRTDPNASALEKQLQYIMSQIPGLANKDINIGDSKITPIERRGPLGIPIENQNRGLNMFSPNRVTTEQPFYEDIYQAKEAKRRLDKLKKEFRERLKIR